MNNVGSFHVKIFQVMFIAIAFHILGSLFLWKYLCRVSTITENIKLNSIIKQHCNSFKILIYNYTSKIINNY